MPFVVIPSDVSEEVRHPLPLREFVVELAARKATSVASPLTSALVIGADTAVAIDEDILGKPADAADAMRTLRMLRGRSHVVASGVAVVDASTRHLVTGVSLAEVTMRDYSDEEIRRYIRSGESFDKAGSYAIQGEGRHMVESIEGRLDTIIGLPLHLVRQLLDCF